MTIPPQLILTIVLIGPGIIAGYIFFKKIQQSRAIANDPIDRDMPIRLPGHNLFIKMERVHEKVTDKIVFLAFPTIAHAGVFYLLFENSSADEWTFIILFVVETGVIALLGFQLWRLLKELQAYQFGYRGEVFVSQLLQPLTLMGYQVYHDIEIGEEKIDHVLVNESGIFCLDTKMYPTPKGTDDGEVSFDGLVLNFPSWQDASGIKGVQRSASLLAKLLKQKLGQSIPVYPILLLPGWKVNRKGRGPVNVINPKELPAGLFYFPEYPLTKEQIDAIETVLFESWKVNPLKAKIPHFQL